MALTKSRKSARTRPSWASIAKKARGNLSPVDFLKNARNAVSEKVTVLRDSYTGGNGDLKCAYRHKDHWAFIDILALLEARADFALNVLKQLDQRIGALEAAATEMSKMAYLGVFKDGETYSPGTFITFGGSLWHCNEQTQERPGEGQAWSLAVKRGRDGKDAKSGQDTKEVGSVD